MGPRTGGRYSNLRSGTYHFNDLYGNVRSEVWKPEQSRTFSHHELVFPTRSSVIQDEKTFMATRHQSVPSCQMVVKPELRQRGIMRNGAAERYHQAKFQKSIMDQWNSRQSQH